MNACLEDSGTSKHGQHLWSINGDNDSNVMILPQRKKQKKKETRKVHVISKKDKRKAHEKVNINKSQKRKLKKIEEDKEKALLLSKSMETVEKYKIPDAVYSLMLSSGNIGQAETVRDRRRREVQFSKAGLSLPQNKHPLKAVVNAQCDSGTDSDINHTSAEPNELGSLQQVTYDVSAFSQSPKDLDDKNGLCLAGEAVNISMIEEVGHESPHSAYKCDERPKGIGIEKPKDQTSMGNLVKCTTQRVAAVPIVVHVSRPKEVDSKRKDLPIVMMEQEVMEAINENISVIICGETGCGKTTQVPQFLYEAGFGSDKATDRRGVIGVTQPRRVAVLATAKRVAFEMGLRLGKEVGFQVRHDRRIGDSCCIKFMTDGILLREVQSDFLLKRYSVLILDEAHERSLNTDILIGMLSRVIQQRLVIYKEQQRKILLGENINPESKIYPLKLILMSATLRVEDFISGNRIFRVPPPVIEVPTRQYPVTTHFSKRTEIVDYIGQAYKKVLAIHKKLPPGGILVFVTGQREVEYLCRRLRKASHDIVENNSKRSIQEGSSFSVSDENTSDKHDMEMINEAFEGNGNSFDGQTDRFSSYEEDHGDFFSDDSDFSDDFDSDSELEGVDEEEDRDLDTSFSEKLDLSSLKAAFEALSGKTNTSTEPDENKGTPSIPKQDSNKFAGPMCVLPLYAMLSASAQLRVFDEIKEGERLVVIATNVAETSLTIPGIKYVVDTGREKVKKYNSSNGMETFEIQWISKASAAQRAGRAGRTGPGHCYRLYSSAVFSNIFEDFSSAEISKVPVDGVVLLMKSMGIDKVSNFPFPTPPERTSLVEADRCLKALEALDINGKLTPLGKAMALYPMSPRHSRMLLTVIQILKNMSIYKRGNFVLGYAIATASALSMSNPFVTWFEELGKTANEEDRSKKKKLKESIKASRDKFSNPSSDALTVAYALQCFEISENKNAFCEENVLHLKTMEEMSKLRKQLLQLVFNQSKSGGQPEFVWTHGTIEDVEKAWRTFSEKSPLRLNEEELLGQAICAGWADRVAKRTRKIPVSEGEKRVNATRYQACVVKEPVYLHRRSSVSKFAPEYLVYSELIYSNRPYIHGSTSVKTEWLVKYASSLCSFSAPLTDPKSYYDPIKDCVFCWVIPTFGPHLWQLPLHNIAIKDDSERVAVFAFCLLEGQVLPILKLVREYFSAPPSSILRPEGLAQKRVGNLLSKLKIKSRIIDSCAKLREVWDENPRELYVEVRDWFQEGFGDRFEKLWAKMQKEAKLDPRERFLKKAKKARS